MNSESTRSCTLYMLNMPKHIPNTHTVLDMAKGIGETTDSLTCILVAAGTRSCLERVQLPVISSTRRLCVCGGGGGGGGGKGHHTENKVELDTIMYIYIYTCT